MYDVYPYINPHKMTGVCDFDTKDTFKKKYTPVKTNVTMTWNIPERRWKVTDIQMMLQEGIVTIDQKSVRSELIFRVNKKTRNRLKSMAQFL